MSHYFSRPENMRLPSGLFFRVGQAEQPIQPPPIRGRDIEQNGAAHHQINYNEFVVPEYRPTKDDNELYLPLLKVSVQVQVVATIAWTKLTQTFTNQAVHPIKEATYCFPLYEKSVITGFTCTVGSGKILKGVVKPKLQAKAEFKEGIARQRVAALVEEHTPEVFETSVGNIPAQTTIKIEICYITELKADLSGHGILVIIPTSVAPRYGAAPNSMSSLGSSKSLAVPHESGLDIQIQISSSVEISKIGSQTHPVSVEMGTRGHRKTTNIGNLSQKQSPPSSDPGGARATLSDRSACLGKDFILLVEAMDGQLLASRALLEQHPKTPNHSALMVSINLRDLYTPNVVARKESNEIIFLADRSGSMQDKMEALKTAMRFFLKSLPGNCTFNICSFGDTYALMWPESRPYSQGNVNAALSYITMNFEADMGGTEILSGLRHVVQQSNSSVNTEVIVLTDGEVWDSENMFNFIRETRASGPKARTRFFALGIGEGVSHHLIEGIGRHGGGLAEVVSVTSTGYWEGRVIRMLEAALMPSTWKVEIIMDDFAITSTNWEERACVQAPHHIPDFHAFTRSSVYFILNQQPSAKTIKIKATASSGEAITAELPIETVESRHACIYALAAKAALGDLESGQSRLHDTKPDGNAGMIEKEIDDLARSEGEKLGTEWSVSSKWTSFVVVDNNSALEKPSRWYQAEKSDLAELTRPRFDARYFPSSSIVPAIGSVAAGSLYAQKKISMEDMSFQPLDWAEECAEECEVEQDVPDCEYRTIQVRQDHEAKVHAPAIAKENDGLRDQAPEHALPVRQAPEPARPVRQAPEPALSVRQAPRPARSVRQAPSGSRSRNEEEYWIGQASKERQQSKSLEVSKRRPMFKNRQNCQEREDLQANKELEARRAPQAREKLQAGKERQSERQRKHQELREDLPAREEAQERELSLSAFTSKDLHRSSKCPELASSSQRYSNSAQLPSCLLEPADPEPCLRGQITREITLEALIDAQAAAGSFNLDSELRRALNQNFKSTMRKVVNDWFRALGLGVSTQSILKALDTAISIVWIEVKYVESRELWGLAVQKAKGFLNTIVSGEQNCFELFKILKGELLNSDEDGTDERGAENKEGNEGNKREVENREANEANEGNEVSGSTSAEQGPILKFLNKFLGLG